MSSRASRACPARQRHALKQASSARGSSPYTATQPISHQAQSRWLMPVAPPAARLPTCCTAAASGTGKPSSAGSAPLSCTKRWKNPAPRMVLSQLSV